VLPNGSSASPERLQAASRPAGVLDRSWNGTAATVHFTEAVAAKRH
jgi:hypothetical protein